MTKIEGHTIVDCYCEHSVFSVSSHADAQKYEWRTPQHAEFHKSVSVMSAQISILSIFFRWTTFMMIVHIVTMTVNIFGFAEFAVESDDASTILNVSFCHSMLYQLKMMN